MSRLGERLAAAAAGDGDAAAAVVREYGPAARRLARALVGDDALADDVVQDAFLAAFRRLGVLRDANAFPAWLRRIVRTEAGRARRRRRESELPAGADAAADAPGPAEAAEERERREIVRTAVAALPPAGRAAVESFYLDGRSIPETARRLGVPPGTVKRRLHDARSRLARLLLGPGGLL